MSAHVDWLWTTPVLAEHPAYPADTLAAMRDQSGERLHDTLDGLGLLDQISEALDESCLTWTIQLCELHAGQYRSPRYDPADVQAYLVLDRTEQSRHEESGTFVFSDPRAGIQNVFVPGMPWNKSVSMRAEPGRLLAAPGWIAAMVTPLAEGESLTWLHLQGHRR